MSGDTLYDLGLALSAAMREVEEQLASTDGEFTDAMQARLDAAETPFMEKVERVALYCRGLALDAAAIKVERNRLADRLRAVQRKRDWLKDSYLRHALESQNRESVKGALIGVSLGLNPPSVECNVDPEFVDPEWTRTKKESVLDKKKILEAHRLGRPLPEGVRVVREPTVKIR